MKALCVIVGKVCAELKFFFQMKIKGHGQGHMIKIYSPTEKVLS